MAENLFVRSDAIANAAWTKARLTPTDATADLTAPDGTNTATKIVEDNTAGATHFWLNAASAVTVRGGECLQVAFWLRGGGTLASTRRLLLLFNDGTGTSSAIFNPRTGLVDLVGSVNVSAFMLPAPNGWFLCGIRLLTIQPGQETNSGQVFFELDGGANGAGISVVYNGDGASGVYLAGLRLAFSGPNAGPVEYIRTDALAAPNPARGAIFSAQNLTLHSETFDDAYWIPNNASINVDSWDAPPVIGDGLTADAIIDTVANVDHGVFNNDITTAVAIGDLYTVSVYVRPVARAFCILYVDSFTNATWFNLNTIAVGTNPNANIARCEDAGNGWCRCSVTYRATQPFVRWELSAANADGVTTYAGAGNEAIAMWGAQLVKAASPGPPQATVGTQVAGPIRNALPTTQNLLRQSEDFVNAAWAKNELTAITGQGLQPYSLNLFTANSITPSVNNAIHFINQGIGSVGPGDLYALSIFAKWQQNEEWMFILSNGGAEGAWFNVRTGTVGAATAGVTGSAMIDAGIPGNPGWYRCDMWLRLASASSPAFCTATANGLTAHVGSNTPCQLWWGASAAKANWTGPYQPTTTAIVNTGAIRNLRARA